MPSSSVGSRNDIIDLDESVSNKSFIWRSKNDYYYDDSFQVEEMSVEIQNDDKSLSSKTHENIIDSTK